MYVSALIVFVITLTHYSAVYYCCMVAIYDVRISHIVSIRTGLKSRLIWSAIIHTVSASSSSLYSCKLGRDLARLAVYQAITVRRLIMIRVGALGTNVWPLIGSQFAKNSWKLDKVDKTRCTWPFEAKNRYDVRLANGRAPGVWFVLGFKMYLCLATKWQGIPFLEKNYLKVLPCSIPGASIF